MRSVALALLLMTACFLLMTACSRNEAPPGPPPTLTGDLQQQCRATEPRALPCMDELFDAYASATLGSAITSDKHSDEAEARAIHLTNCFGDRDFVYVKNIVACWNERTCAAFANCVGTRTQSLLAP